MLKKAGEGHHVFPSGCDSGLSDHCSSDLVGASDSRTSQQDLLHLLRDQGEQVSFLAVACWRVMGHSAFPLTSSGQEYECRVPSTAAPQPY